MQVVFTMKKLGFMTVEAHLQSSNDAGRSDCTDRWFVCVCKRAISRSGVWAEIEVFALH